MGTEHSSHHHPSHPHQHQQHHRHKQNPQNHNHNHNHHNNAHQNHKQPQQHKKILKDSIILPQYGGQVTIDKLNKLIIKKIQLFDFQQEFVLSIIKKRILLTHPNFITLKNYAFESLQDNPQFDSRTEAQKSLYFCYPESQILRLEFEPAIFHVHALILQHCQKRQPMDQNQIRRIMKAVIDCLTFLKHNGTFHGDIKPTTIFINPKTQVVQLVDSFFITNGRSSFESVNQDPGCKSFLTPQQLEKKKKKGPDSLENIYQSEVFCFGLTLLEMMTFQESMNIYELESLQVRKDFIEKKVIEMEAYGYSQQLANLALGCIHKNPLKRPHHQEIQRFFSNSTPYGLKNF